jgi:hypothetical protein
MKRRLSHAFCLAALLSGCTGQIGAPGEHSGGTTGPGGEHTSGGPGSPGGPNDTTCASGMAVPTVQPRIRRLTKLEIRNTVADLFSDTTASLTDEIEPDPKPQGFSTGDERSVDPAYMDTQQHVATQIAADFRKTFDQTKFGATCFATDASARDCADKFVRDFGKRAYRRALTDVDVTALLKVYDAGRATGTDNDFADRFAAGLQYTLTALLQSPEFIFRTEIGDGTAAAGATVQLTPSELASALSYGTIASPPDIALVGAADGNMLSTSDQVTSQVRRLIESHPDRFKAQVQRFVIDWLGIDFDKPDWSNKDKTLYPNFTDATKTALEQETGMFIDDWTSSGPLFTTLLTSSSTFINQANAPVYGVSASSMTLQKQALDPKQRSGILTSPGFLGTYAHTDSSSPVFRGVAIMRKLLCKEPPPVPAMVPPLPPADKTEVKTTRQRFDKHISIAFCNACHSSIDPMGNVFESYDAVGAYRTQENGVPIDSSGGIVGTASSDATFANAIDMVKALSTSADVHECFARQAYRFSVGRVETDADTCAIQGYARAFTDKGLDLRELLVAIAASPAFAVRAAAPAGP